MHHYLSVGKYCVPAFQISQYNKKYGAFIFDWLITQVKSLEKFELMDDWFCSENLVVVDANGDESEFGIRVLDRGTNILFQHEFPTFELGSNKYIDKALILDHIPLAKSKFNYLREKTINYIVDSTELTLLRVDHSWINESQIVYDLEFIKSIFSKYNKNINIQGVGSRDLDISNRHLISYKKIHGSQDWASWGNSQDWIDLLGKKFVE